MYFAITSTSFKMLTPKIAFMFLFATVFGLLSVANLRHTAQWPISPEIALKVALWLVV